MKLIQTEDYLLLIDEEAEVCRGQYRLLNDKVELIHEGHNYPYKGYKIIAYYSLTSEAKELDLPLLPNPFEEVNVEKLALKEYPDGCDGTNRSATIYRRIFIEGYKAAQSKQLELLKRAIQLASDAENIEEVEEEIIQSLSTHTQQLPVSFEPEYETKVFYPKEMEIKGQGWKVSYPVTEKVLKTTINSGGKEELVGTYKY